MAFSRLGTFGTGPPGARLIRNSGCREERKGERFMSEETATMEFPAEIKELGDKIAGLTLKDAKGQKFEPISLAPPLLLPLQLRGTFSGLMIYQIGISHETIYRT